MATSKRPTGISVSRDGYWYNISWKRGETYGKGQQLQYNINGWGWTSVNIGKSATAAAIWINLGNFYPYSGSTFYGVTFRIRGKAKNEKWSAWSEYTYINYVPNKPSLTATLNEQQTNKCVFSWSLSTESTDGQPFANTIYESILVKESNVTDGSRLTWNSSQLGWQTGVKSSSDSVTITESTALLADASYTRWFRVGSRGAAGFSGWTYAKHVYARPYQAQIENANIITTSAEGLTCFVQWVADQVPSHPIDHTTVQYLITVPNSNLSCPSGAQWTDAGISADTEGSDAIRFSIDDTLDKDECLFVRVNTVYDSNITYSAPALAAVGNLKDPTDLTYTPNNTNHTLTNASVDNNSDVPDSFIVLVYKAGSKPEEEIPIGIIVHSASQPLVTPVQCPDWSDEDAFSIGAYAAVGTYEATTDLGYTVNVKMRSEKTIWVGGTVAIAPENVNVIQSAVSGTATVTWDWTWARATHAQLSWTNHNDAWESTDEPEIYTINKSRATRWNISGLELGVKWYIAVRLVSGNPEDETAIYGPWSDAKDIVLSSVPNVPSLQLSSKVITVGEEINASWDFISNDGTAQKSAEICEVINGVYGKYFLSEDTSVITEENNIQLLNGKKYYTKSGSTYTLVPDSNKYSLTTDTAIDSSKTYYARSGSGTTLSPYVFTPVNSPVVADIATYYEITADPKTSGWYEFQQSIAHTSIEKEVVIDTGKLGWAEGEIHSLAVRVTSESGRTTEWSNPVSIVIAEALECEITSTSLVTETIEVNPESFEKADVVTFTTTQEEVFAKLQADINPIQDLHGYDSPWVGGAGKNKFGWKDGTYAIGSSGRALTVENGEATYKVPIAISSTTMVTEAVITSAVVNTSFPAGTYTFSLTSNITPSNLVSSATLNFTNGTSVVNGNSFTLTETATILSITATFTQNYTAGTYTFKVQIEQGSTKTDYAPFANICPISGRNSVGVVDCGKNLFDKDSITFANGVIANDGTINSLSGYKYSVEYIKVTPSTAYAFSGNIVSNSTYNTVAFYDKDKNFISRYTPAVGVPSKFTTPNNCEYLRFNASSTTLDVNTVQLEEGSTATTYEAYNGTTYTTSLGTTVYGGTVDLVSGVLTITKKLTTISSFSGTFGARTHGYCVYKTYLSDRTKSLDSISNMFKRTSAAIDDMALGTYQGGSGQPDTWSFMLPSTITSLTEANNWLSNLSEPLVITENLATPTTIQLTPTQVQTLLGTNNIWADSGDAEIRIAENIRTANSLKELPLTVELDGLKDNIVATLSIERAANYQMDRPDETQFEGHEGEIVCLKQNVGSEIVIEQSDLIGYVDDEAKYKILVMFKDIYGQTMSDSIDFEVHWTHQAIIPEAEVEIDDALIAILTPIAPTGTEEGDMCDIYRLSADRPELIVQAAEFGTDYVDPYPAIGKFGGHRFVFKTANGDYITEDNMIAWTDTGEENDDILDIDKTIIDFDGNQILLFYNVDVGHSWEKDFQQTKYLGGSIQGDWNAGVSRSGSISSTMITLTDTEQILLMKELAEYTGPCHVRTKDGSSFTADIQVSEDRDHSDYDAIATFSMTITRIDTETLDGLTYEQWSQGDEE